MSRVFGLGLQLNEIQLQEVNERRKCGEFSRYESENEAIEIYGTVNKKELTSNFTLVRFFDIGINEDGYWNYSQMSLQMEDAIDCLTSVKFPHCDFLFLLDHSSGHGKLREGGLNEKVMSAKWGGNQSKMRDTTIKDVGPYSPKVEIGQQQSMIFTEHDMGPFYLSESDRLSKKYPRPTMVN